MSEEVAAGFYQDPTTEVEQQRYWDGSRWTGIIQGPEPHVSAGWKPDAVYRNLERYWDGRLWTNNVREAILYDGPVTLRSVARHKEAHLKVTAQRIEWQGEQILWDDVTNFAQTILTSRGVPILFGITLFRGDVKTVFEFAHRKNVNSATAYKVMIEQLRVTLGTRVLQRFLDAVGRGEPVRAAGLVFSPEGFGAEGKEMTPWSQFDGIKFTSYQDIQVQLFRAKGDKRKIAVRAKVDKLLSWVLPVVVEAHVKRYAPDRAP